MQSGRQVQSDSTAPRAVGKVLAVLLRLRPALPGGLLTMPTNSPRTAARTREW